MGHGFGFKIHRDAIGHAVTFHGPGQSRYAEVHVLGSDQTEFDSPMGISREAYEGQAIQRMLEAAFEAGKVARSKELRQMLGVVDRRI